MDNLSRRGLPIWFWGALVALLLIVLSARDNNGVQNEALSQYFAAQPTPAGITADIDLPQLDMSNLSPALREAAADLRRTIGLGESGSPLEPSATTPRLRIEIAEIAPGEGGLVVRGTVTNISTEPVNVPISAFELRDSAGGSYVAGGGASANLQPGDNTPLELTVPLPPGRGLLLVTNLPPDPPAEQRLLATEE
ncbi:MAG: hypothetical protein HC822_09780 [Oscillochloris sp.]|nr:hypothetical protein [Oscillochloris sp.]